jgi:hypothetical protein
VRPSPFKRGWVRNLFKPVPRQGLLLQKPPSFLASLLWDDAWLFLSAFVLLFIFIFSFPVLLIVLLYEGCLGSITYSTCCSSWSLTFQLLLFTYLDESRYTLSRLLILWRDWQATWRVFGCCIAAHNLQVGPSSIILLHLSPCHIFRPLISTLVCETIFPQPPSPRRYLLSSLGIEETLQQQRATLGKVSNGSTCVIRRGPDHPTSIIMTLS